MNIPKIKFLDHCMVSPSPNLMHGKGRADRSGMTRGVSRHSGGCGHCGRLTGLCWLGECTCCIRMGAELLILRWSHGRWPYINECIGHIHDIQVRYIVDIFNPKLCWKSSVSKARLSFGRILSIKQAQKHHSLDFSYIFQVRFFVARVSYKLKRDFQSIFLTQQGLYLHGECPIHPS